MIADTFRNTGLLPTRERAVGRTRQILGRTTATIDVFLLVCAYFAAYRLRIYLLGPLNNQWQLSESLLLVELTTAIWLLVGTYLGLYSGKRQSLAREIAALTWVTLLAAAVLATVAFAFKLQYLGRPLALIYFATAYSEALVFRAVTRVQLLGASPLKRRVIVVGSGPQAEKICRTIDGSASEVIGLISEDLTAWVPHNRKRLGTIEEAEAIFRREIVDEVIFAVPKTKLFEVEHAFAAAEDFGLTTKLSLDFLPHRFAKIDYEVHGGMPMLAFTSAPAHPVQLALKRAFDVSVSLLALILLSPIFAGIALAIRLTSKGPVFFGQMRSGLNGREFKLWKFRTMVPNAETQLASLLHKNEMSGPSSAPGSVFKLKADPRITPIGHFLRKTSLDELPQFWNVLIGDMSVVGPRPLFGVKKYDQRLHCRRLSVKPGITCTWQISGRNEIDFADWMNLDLDYIDNWSLALDLKLFLLTVPAVLFGRGAK